MSRGHSGNTVLVLAAACIVWSGASLTKADDPQGPSRVIRTILDANVPLDFVAIDVPTKQAVAVAVDKRPDGAIARVTGIIYGLLETDQWLLYELDENGVLCSYEDSQGFRALFHSDTDGHVALEFFDPNGEPLGTAQNVEINRSVLDELLALYAHAPNVPASPAGTPAPEMPSVTITSLARTSAVPFSILSIHGTGFRPEDSAISVRFRPRGAGVPHTVPVTDATADTLTVMVPPITDANSGAWIPATVDVQVIQVSNAWLMTSNVLSGLAVSAPPETDPAVPPGALTKTYLEQALEDSEWIRSRVATSGPDSQRRLEMLNLGDAGLRELLAQIDEVSAGSRQNLSLATTDGKTLVMDKAALAALDRLIYSFYRALADELEQAPALGAIHIASADDSQCAYARLGPLEAEAACGGREYRRRQHEAASPLLAPGAELVYGTPLLLSGVYMRPAALGLPNWGLFHSVAYSLSLSWTKDLATDGNITASGSLWTAVRSSLDTAIGWPLPLLKIAEPLAEFITTMLTATQSAQPPKTSEPVAGILLDSPHAQDEIIHVRASGNTTTAVRLPMPDRAAPGSWSVLYLQDLQKARAAMETVSLLSCDATAGLASVTPVAGGAAGPALPVAGAVCAATVPAWAAPDSPLLRDAPADYAQQVNTSGLSSPPKPQCHGSAKGSMSCLVDSVQDVVEETGRFHTKDTYVGSVADLTVIEDMGNYCSYKYAVTGCSASLTVYRLGPNDTAPMVFFVLRGRYDRSVHAGEDYCKDWEVHIPSMSTRGVNMVPGQPINIQLVPDSAGGVMGSFTVVRMVESEDKATGTLVIEFFHKNVRQENVTLVRRSREFVDADELLQQSWEFLGMFP